MSLIDFAEVQRAYDEDRVYSLQLEVGDICCQGCIYCYMNALPEERNTLSETTILEILDDAQRLGISAVEWLGGEPLLRETIFPAMARAAEYGMRNNVWTGGLPLTDRSILQKTAELAEKGLISIHVSTVNPDTYKRLHPDRPEDDLTRIIAAVEELLQLGYPPTQVLNSVTFTGLQSSADMIETIDYFHQRYGIMTSLNVYHTYLRPSQSKSELARFIPDSKEVIRVHSHLAGLYGEKELPMNCVNKQYCSATVAVLTDGSVTPCATIRPENAPRVSESGTFYELFHKHRDELIFKLFKDDTNLPEECRICNLSDQCWGCRSRSYAAGDGIYGRDPRCFRHHPRH